MLHAVAQDRACNEEFIGMALRDIEGINAFNFNLQVGKAEVSHSQVLILRSVGCFFCCCLKARVPTRLEWWQNATASWNKMVKTCCYIHNLSHTPSWTFCVAFLQVLFSPSQSYFVSYPSTCVVPWEPVSRITNNPALSLSPSSSLLVGFEMALVMFPEYSGRPSSWKMQHMW